MRHQARNVKRKAEEAEEHKLRTGKKPRPAVDDDEADETTTAVQMDQAQEIDDDAEYYRQEVGEEPPEGDHTLWLCDINDNMQNLCSQANEGWRMSEQNARRHPSGSGKRRKDGLQQSVKRKRQQRRKRKGTRRRRKRRRKRRSDREEASW